MFEIQMLLVAIWLGVMSESDPENGPVRASFLIVLLWGGWTAWKLLLALREII